MEKKQNRGDNFKQNPKRNFNRPGDNIKPSRDLVGAPVSEIIAEETEGPAAPRGLRPPRAPKRRDVSDSGIVEKVVSINRVSKTTKGGTRLSFSALVVVGDTKGMVGYGLGKAGEVATAIKKSLAQAKKNMIKVPMKGTTIAHEVLGSWGSAKVMLKPASEGTGIIAAGPVRAICDGAGISNILSKCHRSNNPINVVKATFDGFNNLKEVE